jgi:hypothetical protein
MISQLINSMLGQRQDKAGQTVDRVSASQVDYVIRQLKAAGVSLRQ